MLPGSILGGSRRLPGSAAKHPICTVTPPAPADSLVSMGKELLKAQQPIWIGQADLHGLPLCLYAREARFSQTPSLLMLLILADLHEIL